MGISVNFNHHTQINKIYTFLLKIKMKLVYNFYSSFKCSKSKMAAKFGQKIVSNTNSTDVPFLSVV